MTLAKPKLKPRSTEHALRMACYRLGIETRLSQDEREAIYRDASGRPVVRRVVSKRAKASYRAIARESQPQAMTNMSRPAGYRPTSTPAKTKTMLAAHVRRQEAGWLHG